jgi:hypothetical protein
MAMHVAWLGLPLSKESEFPDLESSSMRVACTRSSLVFSHTLKLEASGCCSVLKLTVGIWRLANDSQERAVGAKYIP